MPPNALLYAHVEVDATRASGATRSRILDKLPALAAAARPGARRASAPAGRPRSSTRSSARGSATRPRSRCCPTGGGRHSLILLKVARPCSAPSRSSRGAGRRADRASTAARRCACTRRSRPRSSATSSRSAASRTCTRRSTRARATRSPTTRVFRDARDGLDLERAAALRLCARRRRAPAAAAADRGSSAASATLLARPALRGDCRRGPVRGQGHARLARQRRVPERCRAPAARATLRACSCRDRSPRTRSPTTACRACAASSSSCRRVSGGRARRSARRRRGSGGQLGPSGVRALVRALGRSTEREAALDRDAAGRCAGRHAGRGRHDRSGGRRRADRAPAAAVSAGQVDPRRGTVPTLEPRADGRASTRSRSSSTPDAVADLCRSRRPDRRLDRARRACASSRRPRRSLGANATFAPGMRRSPEAGDLGSLSRSSPALVSRRAGRTRHDAGVSRDQAGARAGSGR